MTGFANSIKSESFTHSAGEALLILFFAILPFAYSAQVLWKSPLPGAVPYVVLFIAIALTAPSAYRKWHSNMRFSVLPALFLCLTLHHLLFSLHEAMFGDQAIALRAFILFSAPLLLFLVMPAIRVKTLLSIVSVIALGGLIVSTELLYEIVETQAFKRSTWFQIANMEYVKLITGRVLTQLYLPGYRPTGLLEHAHASTFFVAISALAAISLYAYSSRRLWVGIAVVETVALFSHGTRMPVIALIFSFLLIAFLLHLSSVDKKLKQRALLAMSACLISAGASLFADPVGTSTLYYMPAVTDADFQVPPGLLFDLAKRLIIESEWWHLLRGEAADLAIALFGHGITGSLSGSRLFSDDLFFLALPLQYGLVGFTVLAAIWAVSIWKSCALLLAPPVEDEVASSMAIFAGGVLFVLSVSMLHSGVIQRKAVFPLLPLSIGIIWSYSRLQARAPAAENKSAMIRAVSGADT